MGNEGAAGEAASRSGWKRVVSGAAGGGEKQCGGEGFGGDEEPECVVG